MPLMARKKGLQAGLVRVERAEHVAAVLDFVLRLAGLERGGQLAPEAVQTTVHHLTVVRKFDAKTGAPKGEIPIPGSTFLNDLAIAKDGRVFVSDSGVKVGPKGFEPTGTDSV
jgi:hypothetical protein